MRVADYIAQALVQHGVTDVFLLPGGGAMHLNDALGRTPGLRYTAFLHEQACAIAAEGYFRASGRMAAVNVTSGPGGTNTMTGVLGQWLDSVPAIYLSGQVKRETTLWAHPNLGLRQLGDQELPIVDLVRPITKLAVMVTEASQIRRTLEHALWLAREGRPGPVWVDVPLDLQGAQVDPSALEGFTPPAAQPGPGAPLTGDALDAAADQTLAELARCQRPVLLAGFGIRLAGGQEALLAVAEALGVPLLASLNGCDLVPTAHPLFAGRPGTVGTRAGNFVVQNADLFLSVGARNNIRQVSYSWKAFARAARKVIVDIDPAELKKPTIVPDVPIHADARLFLEALLRRSRGVTLPDWSPWRAWCAERRRKYFGARPEEGSPQPTGIDPYPFVESLTRHLPEDAVLVSGNGTAFFAPFQVGEVKRGQRFIWNDGCASMGFDLPAALGASLSRPGQRVVCLAGDGSLQMNVQELQTLAHHRWPITLFILNNGGYVSMRQTQGNFFGKFVGAGPDSGVSNPDFVKLAEAYGLSARRIEGPGWPALLADALAPSVQGPLVVEVMLDTTHTFHPKLSSARLPDGRMVSKPLEDLSPLLPRDEFRANMLVPEWPE